MSHKTQALEESARRTRSSSSSAAGPSSMAAPSAQQVVELGSAEGGALMLQEASSRARVEEELDMGRTQMWMSHTSGRSVASTHSVTHSEQLSSRVRSGLGAEATGVGVVVGSGVEKTSG